MAIIASEEPLLQICATQDVHAQGIHRLEVFGGSFRVIYWTRMLADDGMTWQKVSIPVAIVMPLRAMPADVERRYRVVRYGQMIEGTALRMN